jgi:hypothetical protein
MIKVTEEESELFWAKVSYRENESVLGKVIEERSESPNMIVTYYRN